MPFDQKTRNLLQRTVSACRKILDEEFAAQRRKTYGINDDGSVAPLEMLGHLPDEEMQTARLLRDRLDHLAAGLTTQGKKESDARKEAVGRLTREQAFTVLNRLAALRMAEEREIVLECVRNGLHSEGFLLFQQTAGSAFGETWLAYRAYLLVLFDELAIDLGVLFSRWDPAGLLFPGKDALEAVLKELGGTGTAMAREDIMPEDFNAIWSEDETIGWIDEDGSYQVPWGHSHVPGNWTPLMLRLPFSESGRQMAPLASFALWNLWPDNPLRSDRHWRDLRDIISTVGMSLNPGWKIGANFASLGDAAPPRDPYSGRDIVPKDQWDSGMWSRIAGLAHDTVAQLPIPLVEPPQALKNETLPEWLNAALRIPGVKSAVALDNLTLAPDYEERLEDRDAVNRKARLLRGPATKRAVSLLYRLERIPPDSRKPNEAAQIDVLRSWYNEAYIGTELYPGLYPQLQASAAGAGGVDVEGVKETLERTAETVLERAEWLGR